MGRAEGAEMRTTLKYLFLIELQLCFMYAAVEKFKN